MMTDRGARHGALRSAPFLRLYGIRLISQLSDGVFQVGLAAYVIFSPEQQATAPQVAAAFATVLLPYSLVGPFAGVYLDRWPRHRILVVANLARAALVVVVAALVATGHEGAEFFAAALLVISVNRFFLAALSASLPHVVGMDTLISANALSTTSGTLVSVIGAGVGFGVRHLSGSTNSGVGVVIVVAAALYLVAGLAALTVPPGSLGPDAVRVRVPARDEMREVLRGIRDGAAHLRDRRPAAHALAAITGHRFFYGISTVATLLLYRNYFPSGTDLGLDGVAAVVGLSGVGYVVGAVLTPPATRALGRPRWISLLLLAAGVVEVAFGLPYTSPLLMAGSFLLGIVAQGAKVTVDTIVQTGIDDAFRGRVFAFYDIVFNVTFVLATIAVALTLPPTGKSYPILTLIAVGYVATGALYGWRDRAYRPRGGSGGRNRSSTQCTSSRSGPRR